MQEVLSPSLLAMQSQITQAIAQGHTLNICGTRNFSSTMGLDNQTPTHPPRINIDTTQHCGIVSYEPTELVITAKCGTPLVEIEAALDQHDQCFAFEPPNFSANATLGSMVATGLSGPARATAGSVRDFVLGTQLLDGRANLLNFGGVVMKNVAGYDVSRLLVGSRGSLGVITQASIKVWPKVKTSAYLQFELTQTQAIEQLNRWGALPLPITASCWTQGVLTVRLGGASSAVNLAVQTMGGDICQGQALFDSLRHQHHPFFTPREGLTLMRLSVPSTSVFALPDDSTLIEWGGALRWAHVPDVAATRALASKLGGHATLWGGAPAQQDPVYTPLDPVSQTIHTRLKAEFDPHQLFSA